MKKFYKIAALSVATLAFVGCTNLDETLYDKVSSSNYYNTRDNVIAVAYRAFDHGYWSVQWRQVLNEETGDQLITPTRDGWFDDGGIWRRYHDHTYDVDMGHDIADEWNNLFQGIELCTVSIEELQGIDFGRFNISVEEGNNFIAQNRALRAWFYLRALDEFRNLPLVRSFNDQSQNTLSQVDPKVIYDYIKDDLEYCIDNLVKKDNTGGNGILQGQFTKAAAATLLARLYINAKVYINEDHFADAAAICQEILDGKYGTYKVADRWDEAYDWDNETSDEVIFAFPSSGAHSYHMWARRTYWATVPHQAGYYFKDQKCVAGGHNCMYACSPSYDLNGILYDYKLGMTVQKFRKYPGDERLKLYRNLGNSKREGMMLFGKLPYQDGGVTKYVKAPAMPYELCMRDAVGQFYDLPEGQWPSNKDSRMENGDMNSGYHFVKYPMYSDDDKGQIESDYVEMRLPEVIYMLAECKLRNGDASGAGQLLNSVRKRNYPQANLSQVLYAPDGAAKLDMDEMLDEWGREFFAEGRRRIDLIRFGRFTDGWWDKTPDTDDHTIIFPIMRKVLDANPALKQNPGYNN